MYDGAQIAKLFRTLNHVPTTNHIKGTTMKPISASLLAVALSAAFTSAYAQDAKPDPAAYRTMTQKAAADFKAANANCKQFKGTERAVCADEAKVARARADVDAVGQYNNTVKARTTARTALANAEYALAKAKCASASGAEKDSCVANADSVRIAALANAKADRDISNATAAAAAGIDNKGTIATTATTDPAKAAAVDKCAQIAGRPDTGCLIDNKDRTAATTTTTTTATTTAGAAVETAADRTRNAAANIAQKTENVADAAVQKTKEVASNVANKTERVAENVADRTERTADTAAARTGKAVSDTVITTKVKADLFKEPELSAMAIHVETEKGVVMLSGFVDSKADAEKAVRLAKSVEGVTSVKSAIKVK